MDTAKKVGIVVLFVGVLYALFRWLIRLEERPQEPEEDNEWLGGSMEVAEFGMEPPVEEEEKPVITPEILEKLRKKHRILCAAMKEFGDYWTLLEDQGFDMDELAPPGFPSEFAHGVRELTEGVTPIVDPNMHFTVAGGPATEKFMEEIRSKTSMPDDLDFEGMSDSLPHDIHLFLEDEDTPPPEEKT